MANVETPFISGGGTEEIIATAQNSSGGRASKKEEFKQEIMFGLVAKIPTGNTLSELVEMDFVDYG